MFPILDVLGGCKETDKETERILIKNAVKYINMAGKFKGIPHGPNPHFSNNANMEVSFSLMFPTEKDIQGFIKCLKR